MLALYAGINVVLLLTTEHRGISKAALKVARMFVRNIVDRLHIVVFMPTVDSKPQAKQVRFVWVNW